MERTWGCSYSKFAVEHLGVRLERTVFAPFGDSPFFVASIHLTNLGKTAQTLTHIEYWDLHLHNIDYMNKKPWEPDQRTRDEISARLYSGYAGAYDEKFGALIARHPWAAMTSEESLNWPNPTVSNRPDVSLVPMGVTPTRLVTEREVLFAQVSHYLPKFLEEDFARPGASSREPAADLSDS